MRGKRDLYGKNQRRCTVRAGSDGTEAEMVEQGKRTSERAEAQIVPDKLLSGGGSADNSEETGPDDGETEET